MSSRASQRVQVLSRHLGAVQESDATISVSDLAPEHVAAKREVTLRPFHHAFPVSDLEKARWFYGTVLQCEQGREAPGKWIDYNMHGSQIVCHFVGKDYVAPAYTNPVDDDEVPVPHFGAVLTEELFHELADRLRKVNTKFVVEPHLRFKGFPGEQWTMFFKDPSGNALEFKAMANPENLFAKYSVKE
mmetsp:Transcript_20129/g.35777  ORF Transcript_20129/g.35777 Transcript_20129/m.35777 type:complete len:188 (-) Transcript_20129:117-680(-)